MLPIKTPHYQEKMPKEYGQKEWTFLKKNLETEIETCGLQGALECLSNVTIELEFIKHV